MANGRGTYVHSGIIYLYVGGAKYVGEWKGDL